MPYFFFFDFFSLFFTFNLEVLPENPTRTANALSFSYASSSMRIIGIVRGMTTELDVSKKPLVKLIF